MSKRFLFDKVEGNGVRQRKRSQHSIGENGIGFDATPHKHGQKDAAR